MNGWWQEISPPFFRRRKHVLKMQALVPDSWVWSLSLPALWLGGNYWNLSVLWFPQLKHGDNNSTQVVVRIKWDTRNVLSSAWHPLFIFYLWFSIRVNNLLWKSEKAESKHVFKCVQAFVLRHNVSPGPKGKKTDKISQNQTAISRNCKNWGVEICKCPKVQKRKNGHQQHYKEIHEWFVGN